MRYVNVKTNNAKKSGKKSFRPVLVFFGIIAAFLLFGAFALSRGAKSLFDPVSIVASVTASDLKQTDGRTNVLLLGSDKRTSGALSGDNTLTDTIMVASIDSLSGDVVLISIPRDLWVTSPKGYQSKINALYADGGAAELKTVVEQVLNLPIHYYAKVDFGLFTQAIDSLGGVQVTVDNSFEDFEYPIQGKEDDSCGRSQDDVNKMEGAALYVIFPCRYEHLVFNAGPQTMDGATALKFVRSRHGTNNEGTDFARAKRQQKIIVAVKEKALSTQTLFNPSKLKDLYDAYHNNVDTDIDLGTVQAFYLLSKKVDLKNARSIVLDDRSSSEQGGLLYSPTDTSLYGGAYVLVPRAGDYSQLHAYVQRYVFGSGTN